MSLFQGRGSRRDAVAAALKELSAEGREQVPLLFREWYSSKSVAERAGVSEGTARKHLDDLTSYRGYSSRVVYGVRAYRYAERPWE